MLPLIVCSWPSVSHYASEASQCNLAISSQLYCPCGNYSLVSFQRLIAALGGASPMPGCLSRSPAKNSAATGLLLTSESKCGRHCSGWCPPWHLGGQWGSLALAILQPVSLNQASATCVSWNPLDRRYQEGIRHAGQWWKECPGRITGRIMKDSEMLGLGCVVKGDGSRAGRGWSRKRIKPQSSASAWSSILEIFNLSFPFIFSTSTKFVPWFQNWTETCSVAQSCLTLCNPMDCSTPGFPILHHLLELAQTLLHWVSDAIHLSHPLLTPPPPAFYFPQHQGLFQWVGSSLQMVKLELHHQSFQWIFRVDFL